MPLRQPIRRRHHPIRRLLAAGIALLGYYAFVGATLNAFEIEPSS